jgi:predicted transcriptional regulator YdeE
MAPFYSLIDSCPYTIFPIDNNITCHTNCGTITISYGQTTTSPTISSHETQFIHYCVCYQQNKSTVVYINGYQQQKDKFKEELDKLTLPLKCSTLHEDVFKERINKVESQVYQPMNLQVNARSCLPRKERKNET